MARLNSPFQWDARGAPSPPELDLVLFDETDTKGLHVSNLPASASVPPDLHILLAKPGTAESGKLRNTI